MTQIIPAVLTRSIVQARQRLREIQNHTNKVHVDVTDGNFVPNHTFPPSTVELLKTRLVTIVHAMCYHPEWYVKEWKKCKVLFHAEASQNIAETAKLLRKTGKKPGIAVNPTTPIEIVEPALRYVDEVLVMTVTPGYMGQAFHPRALTKLRWVKEKKKTVKVSVDGHMNEETIPLAIAQGADICYVGSALLENFGENWKKLKKAARS